MTETPWTVEIDGTPLEHVDELEGRPCISVDQAFTLMECPQLLPWTTAGNTITTADGQVIQGAWLCEHAQTLMAPAEVLAAIGGWFYFGEDNESVIYRRF